MLEERILNDFKEAMKKKETVKVSILSFMRAQFTYVALEKKKKALDDADCIAVVKKLIKQHQDSIEQFKAGGRLDLVEKEEKELGFLRAYLPPELSEAEVKKIVDEAVAATGATGIKDMGKVMKEVLARAAGQADAKLVSELVKARLG